jgi:hypothetical protein
LCVRIWARTWQINCVKRNDRFMTDKLTDGLLIKIYEMSGTRYFSDDIRYILEDVIKELYYSHGRLMLKLRLNHIDRAIFKYRQAKEKKRIWNAKQYFKACLLSAIKEASLDELESVEE